MKPAYIQIKDNIHIRLDFFDTNIIRIVNKDGYFPEVDKILSTFPLLESYKLSEEDRVLFKNTIKELSGISPEEIENAIFEMEEQIKKIEFIKLPKEKLIEIGKGKITKVTGAPRSQKTTKTLEMAVMDKTNNIISVVRTIKTLQQTIETIDKHVPILKDVPITPLIGKTHICKLAQKIVNECGYRALRIYCGTCPNQKTVPLNLTTPLHLSPEDIVSICEKENACPAQFIKDRIKHFTENNAKQIIITTYARLKHPLKDLKDSITLGDHVTIFDEARHINEMAILHTLKLNEYPTKSPHNKIIENYVEEVYKIDFSMLSPEAQEEIDYARDIWCKNILEGKEFTTKFTLGKTFGELYYLFNEPATVSLDGTPRKRIDYSAQLSFVDLLDKANDNNVALDIITSADKENTVNLIIRDMDDDNVESRYNFYLLMSTGKQTYLVDSTPYPKHYYGFWLGAEYELKEYTFLTKYKFNIVIENTIRTLKNTYLDPENVKRFTDIIKGISKSLKLEIFSSSKKETENLKKYEIDCKHARGTEVEGVQSDKDYTLITRLPLQNLNSEKYRENTILKMNDDKGNHMEYIKIKAFQELLQESFRTAKRGKSSGSFWMCMDDSEVYLMKRYWTWLDDMLFITLPRCLRLDDKVDYTVQGLRYGKLSRSKSESEIAMKILVYFKAHPEGTKTECVDSIIGKRDKVFKVLNQLIDEGILKF